MGEIIIENLKVLATHLELSKKLLVESYQVCQAIDLKDDYARQDLVELEVLSWRFARTSNLLLQKIFRAIDSVELVEGGTMIDALNRAHKRNLIDSLEQMYSIRELRNGIVHEYLPKGLQEIFADLIQKTPLLISLIDRALEYSKKLRL